MSNAMIEQYLKRQQTLSRLFNYEKLLICLFRYETQQLQNETSKQSQKSNCLMLNKYCIHKTDSFVNNYKKRLMKGSKNDCVWMLRLCKIYFKNINKMPIEWITERETQPLFKIFLKRIGFKNYDEYIELFGDDLEKRKETVRRFKKTYPLFTIKKQEKWKTS